MNGTLPPDAPEPPPLTVITDRVGDHWRRSPDPSDPKPWTCLGGAPDPADSATGAIRTWGELQKESPLMPVASPTPDAAPSYTVIGDWLVEDNSTCNCAGGGYSPHEPYCGVQPIAKIADLPRAVPMERALTLIAGTSCENSTTGPGACWRDYRDPDAAARAERWCDSCIALAALTPDAADNLWQEHPGIDQCDDISTPKTKQGEPGSAPPADGEPYQTAKWMMRPDLQHPHRARKALRAFVDHLNATDQPDPHPHVIDALNSALLAYDPADGSES